MDRVDVSQQVLPHVLFPAIAPQTKTALLGFLLMAIAMIITAIQTKIFNWSTVVSFLIFLVTSLLALYITNCTVFGHCTTYATIYSYFILIIGIAAVLILLLSMAGFSSASDSLKKMKSTLRK
jgi:hypothetical protein